MYAAAAAAKSLQSCPTLCDPRDGSPPGSPVPGILQARTLELGAIAFSKIYVYIHINMCAYMCVCVCVCVCIYKKLNHSVYLKLTKSL